MTAVRGQAPPAVPAARCRGWTTGAPGHGRHLVLPAPASAIAKPCAEQPSCGRGVPLTSWERFVPWLYWQAARRRPVPCWVWTARHPAGGVRPTVGGAGRPVGDPAAART